MTLISVGSLGLLWFFTIQSITPDNPGGGFMLVFFAPLLLITTIGALISVGKLWFEKSS